MCSCRSTCDPSGRFGIVGVDHVDVVDAQHAVDFSHGLPHAGRGRDIVAGRRTMAGVDTEADSEIRQLGGELPHDAKFLQPAAERRARAGRVFEQHSQLLVSSPCAASASDRMTL